MARNRTFKSPASRSAAIFILALGSAVAIVSGFALALKALFVYAPDMSPYYRAAGIALGIVLGGIGLYLFHFAKTINDKKPEANPDPQHDAHGTLDTKGQ